MKLADSNIWLALAVQTHIFHDEVQAWLASQPNSGEVLFCRATQKSFLRLLTTAAALKPYGAPPLTNRQAWALYSAYRADPRTGWSDEPPGLEGHWQTLALRDTSSPKIWMDSYLAAFALAGRHQLVTTDQGFKQHSGLDLLVLAKGPTV